MLDITIQKMSVRSTEFEGYRLFKTDRKKVKVHLYINEGVDRNDIKYDGIDATVCLG